MVLLSLMRGHKMSMLEKQIDLIDNFTNNNEYKSLRRKYIMISDRTKQLKESYKMTQMERIEHRKKIEKWAKDNVQELLLGNDWLKSGDYTPSRKLQENVSYYELECMPLGEFLQLADLVTAESPGTYTMNDLVRKLAK